MSSDGDQLQTGDSGAMKIRPVGLRPRTRLLLGAGALAVLVGIFTGALPWAWTQAASLTAWHAPMHLPLADATRAMWRLLLHGGWRTPARAFPRASERVEAPGALAYLAFAGVASAYGAAGSLLVGLLWIYYSAIILLLGAEFTKVAAGRVATVAPSTVRTLSDQPAGIDPREASRSRAS